ncbi:MAG: hypothetical protein QM645_07880 [Asticcacaulis sp.]
MRRYNEQELRAANVNPATGLATDYLNLFNEAIMLFEMGMDMPDMAEELSDWAPRDYVTHFEQSGFEQKDVVIAAYQQAEADTRLAFDDCCAHALEVFQSAVHILLSSSIAATAPREDLEARLEAMKALVLEMDAHIHGRHDPVSSTLQSEVDALF